MTFVKYFLLIFSLLSLQLHAKEIKVIIPYSAGGPTDKVSRIVIKHLNSDTYKFVPEYRLGAGGTIAANYVASVKDDTVIMITSNALVSSPLLTSTTTYNLEKDFVDAIVSYAKNPSKLKALMKGAVNKFGVMPQQNFSNKDLQKIAKYIYNNPIKEPEWFKGHFGKEHKKIE